MPTTIPAAKGRTACARTAARYRTSIPTSTVAVTSATSGATVRMSSHAGRIAIGMMPEPKPVTLWTSDARKATGGTGQSSILSSGEVVVDLGTLRNAD